VLVCLYCKERRLEADVCAERLVQPDQGLTTFFSSDILARNCNWGPRLFPLPFPFPFCPFFPASLSFTPLSSPALPFSPASLPLEIGLPKISKRSGERCELPQRGLGEPQLKSNLVHFSFIRWDLVATILIIFPKINWPNWQILCSLYVCLCFVWRIGGGLGLLGPPWLRHCFAVV